MLGKRRGRIQFATVSTLHPVLKGVGHCSALYRASIRHRTRLFCGTLVNRPPFALGDVAGVIDSCFGLFESVADRERVAICLMYFAARFRSVGTGRPPLLHRTPSGALEVVFGFDSIHPKCGSLP
jgi:hypothetical protein